MGLNADQCYAKILSTEFEVYLFAIRCWLMMLIGSLIATNANIFYADSKYCCVIMCDFHDLSGKGIGKGKQILRSCQNVSVLKSHQLNLKKRKY